MKSIFIGICIWHFIFRPLRADHAAGSGQGQAQGPEKSEDWISNIESRMRDFQNGTIAGQSADGIESLSVADNDELQFAVSKRAAETCVDIFPDDKSCATFTLCCKIACHFVRRASHADCVDKNSIFALICLCGGSIEGAESAQSSMTDGNTRQSLNGDVHHGTKKPNRVRPSTQSIIIPGQPAPNDPSQTQETPTGKKQCGKPAVDGSMGDRIIGGAEAVPRSWPWQVSLQFHGRHICGGSLVAPYYVLTAAHCVEHDLNVENYQVVLGLYDVHNVDDGQKTSVSEIHVHGKRNASMNPSYDAALLRLAEPVTYTEDILPICLPNQEATGNVLCMATGWGQVDPINRALPVNLMQVRLTITDRSKCKEAKFGVLIDDSMVCAGNDVKGACKGDSGGPLVCKDEEGVWSLCGITSFSGKNCTLSGDPTVFCDVFFIKSWIISILHKQYTSQ